jgi:hypothetical protein
VQAGKLELYVRDESGVQDNFRTAIGTLNDCNIVVEHHCVEVTCEDAYCCTRLPVAQLNALEENIGNRGD